MNTCGMRDVLSGDIEAVTNNMSSKIIDMKNTASFHTSYLFASDECKRSPIKIARKYYNLRSKLSKYQIQPSRYIQHFSKFLNVTALICSKQEVTQVQ